MKLSVLITTYNLEKYIDETLKSVVEQETDFEYEILVGDDGSADKTADRVREWMDKYPSLIKLYVMDRDPDKKYHRIERASKNRINLIKHAKGEYLIFLDGDDWYTDKEKLKKQVDILDRSPGAVLCAHNINIYHSEESCEKMLNFKKEFTVEPEFYWESCMYFHSDTVMFRNVFASSKESMAVLKNPVFSKYYDDNIIVYLLLKYGKMIYIPDVMANYRQLENSSWNSVSEVEKSLINIVDYDLERRINLSFRGASKLRHVKDIFSALKNYKSITPEVKEKYLAIAERDELKTVKRILKSHAVVRFFGILGCMPYMEKEFMRVIKKKILYTK